MTVGSLKEFLSDKDNSRKVYIITETGEKELKITQIALGVEHMENREQPGLFKDNE